MCRLPRWSTIAASIVLQASTVSSRRGWPLSDLKTQPLQTSTRRQPARTINHLRRSSSSGPASQYSNWSLVGSSMRTSRSSLALTLAAYKASRPSASATLVMGLLGRGYTPYLATFQHGAVASSIVEGSGKVVRLIIGGMALSSLSL